MSMTAPATSRDFSLSNMHSETGAAFSSRDPAANILEGATNVGGEEVNAADIEAHGCSDPDSHLAVIGVNEVGNVNCCTTGREVTGRPQIEDLTIFQTVLASYPAFPMRRSA